MIYNKNINLFITYKVVTKVRKEELYGYYN